ncbi:MAG: two-component regulator propeller domain-containing protein [Bacteroidota bacterium]
MKNVISLLLFFLLAHGQMIAQYQFTNFLESEGLPARSCRGMAVDSSGTLWVGTSEGVAKWNGSNFVHVPIDDSVSMPFVNVIEVAPDGNIWIGYLATGDKLGLSVIDPDGNLLLRADSILSGEAGTWVFDIAFGPDSLTYVAHIEGISTYDGSEWNSIVRTSENYAAAPVYDLLFDRDSSLWVGTFFGLAHRHTDGRWENFYTLSTDIISNNIRTLEQDAQGRLWIGTGNGLSIYDGQNFENYEMDQGLPDIFLRDITFDASNNAWIGTDDGFSVFDGASFQNFKTFEDDFIGNTIRDVVIHPTLGTWLTTRRGVFLVEQVATSTEDKPLDLDVQPKVFPNPTHGPVNLLWEKEGLLTVSIFSSQGQLVKTLEPMDHERAMTTDLSSMPSGIYWLRIETKDGLLTKKIVKQ